MTPLDFIASLDGEAKAAALAMFEMCAWLEKNKGTINPEVLEDYESATRVIWLKRNLQTGRLVKDCAGENAAFSCIWVMECIEPEKWQYRLYLGDDPYETHAK